MPKSPERCQEMRDEMRDKILRKSMLYFARNGFAGTKISDLAKHIGIGQGTIYVYFKSKEELFGAIAEKINADGDLRELKILCSLPISGKMKICRLTKTVMKRLESDENFAGMIALNTQMMFEKSGFTSGEATYCSELYKYTAKIIAEGQSEGTMTDGSPMKLADLYWGVVYLYALKKLFTTEYEMISADDLNRLVLKDKRRNENE